MFAAFETCTIPVGDDHRPHRGIRAKCAHCLFEEVIAVNSVQSHGRGFDDEVVERMVTQKFEKHGWKIGKTAPHHRCPKCFIAIKSAAKRKGEAHMSSKIVSMITPPLPLSQELNASTAISSQTVDVPRGERAMSRDERRLIIAKMQDIYLNETVGYAGDWSDEKVAKDMGVPRIWVAQIRDETFGPDINEDLYKALHGAKELANELQAATHGAEPVIRMLQELMVKAEAMEMKLRKMEMIR